MSLNLKIDTVLKILGLVDKVVDFLIKFLSEKIA